MTGRVVNHGLLLVVVLGPLTALHAADGRRPNVILLLTDDQGFGDLSCHGNPVLKTPHMDALHDEAVRFGNLHVDAYCSPTRAALMTGRYAHRVGVWRTIAGRNLLRDGELTMAEVFRHNGYRTGHFGKWHLGAHYPYRPIDRGFDEWLGHGDGGTGTAGDAWDNDRVNDLYIHNGRPERRAGFEADVFFDEAMRFMRSSKDRPFFVYLATYNPHSPCSLPDKTWADPYRDKVPLSTAYFFASIARVDENLGRLRRFLQEEGLSDSTILIFLTDNGTAEGEKVFNAGMRGKKGDVFDGGHRVPCFFHWPAGGLKKPADVNRLAAHVDLLPTLVDLCSLKLPRPVAFDGVSLKPLLYDSAAPWPERTLVVGTPRNRVDTASPPMHWECGAVMTDRWRLVNRDQLYDVTTDAGQRQNVAQRHPAVAKRLLDAYEEYWAGVSAGQETWQGRPILGTPHEEQTCLTSESWTPAQGTGCPWSQGHIAEGTPAFGYWTVRLAKAGFYRIEVRRWPRGVDVPMAGAPSRAKTPDAVLRDQPVLWQLYGAAPRALPVAAVRLRIGEHVDEADVGAADQCTIFRVELDAGSTEIEAQLLDDTGRPLCGAYFVCVRPEELTE